MKFNSTYTSSTTKKETIIKIDLYKNKLINYLKKQFKSIRIDSPLFLEEHADEAIDMPNITRPISFDSGHEYKVNKIYLSHTNWLRKMIDQIDVNNHEGLLTESKTIWRDIEFSPSIFSSKSELLLQYKIDKEKATNTYLKNIAFDIYDLLFSFLEDSYNSMNEKNPFPEDVKIFSSQNLNIEYVNLSASEKEYEKILKEDAFILSEPGIKLFSNKKHKFVPEQLYELKKHYEIIFKDVISSDIINVASIAILANGNELEDQLRYYKKMQYLELDFYKKLTKQKFKILEIKIDLYRIMMVILRKGHIGEVQSGVDTKETKTIIEKYKINII
ncbi:hypothetical protein [Candidatus Mycoplasma mahonii]|uniref:hypothetical protein n=1 Tax=Candidatus Mycoplasma mahonii TaxID=3004105 RepID=UPI0026F052B3|nr:hypothetical protein [Candidatus Mycoplasma mahonii]WKX02557.1 hypothetical protein O3I44_00550 [Candidatus Mycoplasma mahonii]